uniref:Zinc finger RING-type eukaryotic domain-containing protein n=1 Tax=Ciona savignyi TaxID=51511 RepID=H2ZLC1_CIOSA
MLGALKIWATGPKSKFSPRSQRKNEQRNRRGSLPVLSPREPQESDVDDKDSMVNYGHLLTCPLCDELFTHPVLLPCQHSMCYGCARAQILSDDTTTPMIEEIPDEDSAIELSMVASPSVTSSFASSPRPGLSRKNSDPDFDFSSTSTRSRGSPELDNDPVRCILNSPQPSQEHDDHHNKPSLVLSTKDLLHFKASNQDSKSSTRSLKSLQSSPKSHENSSGEKKSPLKKFF